jgi:hypothetical protein
MPARAIPKDRELALDLIACGERILEGCHPNFDPEKYPEDRELAHKLIDRGFAHYRTVSKKERAVA